MFTNKMFIKLNLSCIIILLASKPAVLTMAGTIITAAATTSLVVDDAAAAAAAAAAGDSSSSSITSDNDHDRDDVCDYRPPAEQWILKMFGFDSVSMWIQRKFISTNNNKRIIKQQSTNDENEEGADVYDDGMFHYPPKSIWDSDWIRRRPKTCDDTPYHDALISNNPKSCSSSNSNNAMMTTIHQLRSDPPTIDDIKDWDFDPLRYEHEALIGLFPTIIEYYGYDEMYSIPRNVLYTFSKEVLNRHKPVVYHNWFHITSVLHMTFMILEDGDASLFLEDRDIFALLFGAFIHDVEHPGWNNDYENEMNTEISQKYDRLSVIENYSLDVTFHEILTKKDCNVLEGFDEIQVDQIEDFVREVVLRTDVKRYHGQIAKRLKTFRDEAITNHTIAEANRKHAKSSSSPLSLSSPSSNANNNDEKNNDVVMYFDEWNKEHRMILCQAIIKAADIANPTIKDIKAVQDWALRVSMEFKNQVQLEKVAGLDYLDFMDVNDEYDLSKGQIGFYKFMVLPFFDALGDVLPRTKFLYHRATENLKFYERYVEYVEERKKKEEEEQVEKERIQQQQQETAAQHHKQIDNNTRIRSSSSSSNETPRLSSRTTTTTTTTTRTTSSSWRLPRGVDDVIDTVRLLIQRVLYKP